MSPADLYCTLEVDSFGYFVNKAKTRVYRDTAEPNWNEVRRLFPQCLAATLVLGASEPPEAPQGFPRRPPLAFRESPGGGVTCPRCYLHLPEKLALPPPRQRNDRFCWRSVWKKNLKGPFVLPLLLLSVSLVSFHGISPAKLERASCDPLGFRKLGLCWEGHGRGPADLGAAGRVLLACPRRWVWRLLCFRLRTPLPSGPAWSL